MVESRARIQIARPDILRFFEGQPQKIFKLSELERIFRQQRETWKLAASTTSRRFVEFLIDHGKLQRLDFPFPYRRETRYVWGDVPLLEVLLTLKPDAYYTHYTAMRLHGLTEQVPKTIYLNSEQRPHTPSGDLQQAAINNAFKARPRVSQNIIDFGDVRICLVNGMYTGQLGVVTAQSTYDETAPVNVRVTNLERTLIDIAVRPVYSGGLREVLKAYELAKGRVSVNRLAATLQRLQYVYPYHQAIGFYLDRAGYKSTDIELLDRFPKDYDFYLAHQMKETEYVNKWRLFIPKGF